MTTARRKVGPRMVARCCRCGKGIWRGQSYQAWDEEGRTMFAHVGCRPPGDYRSPSERGVRPLAEPE